MKKFQKWLFVSAILFLFTFDLKAQDIMILRNKPDSLKVKILEIGTTEIKYKIWPVEESMPVLAESKDRIKRVILQNGTVLRFSENEFVDATNYSDQRKMLVKMDMLSTMFGTTSLAFEKNIEPGRSWELGLGIIGAGFNNEDYSNRKGVLIRAGYKFSQTPDYYIRGMRYMHIMKGAYVRPELVFNAFTATTSTYNSTANGTTWPYTYKVTRTDTKENFSAISIMLNFGKQWVFSDVFAVDLFTGIGIGSGNRKEVSSNTVLVSNNSSSYYYDYGYNENDPSIPLGTGLGVSYRGSVGITGQVGLKLGYLIGAKKISGK